MGTISAPLNRLTSKEVNGKGDKLSENCTEAFNSLKISLISKPIVDYPLFTNYECSTGTGEINGGLGAMLCQKNKKEKKE